MLVGAYGLFWERDGVDWSPGSGRAAWQMLGRKGTYRRALRVVDFRRARGVYVLFNHHGAYYAGLAQGSAGLGGRLKQHLSDEHRDKWQRFCWFSFDGVGPDVGSDGLYQVAPRNKPVPANGRAVISELEALLITILGTQGQNKMRFAAADEWQQVPWYDEVYLQRARS